MCSDVGRQYNSHRNSRQFPSSQQCSRHTPRSSHLGPKSRSITPVSTERAKIVMVAPAFTAEDFPSSTTVYGLESPINYQVHHSPQRVVGASDDVRHWQQQPFASPPPLHSQLPPPTHSKKRKRISLSNRPFIVHTPNAHHDEYGRDCMLDDHGDALCGDDAEDVLNAEIHSYIHIHHTEVGSTGLYSRMCSQMWSGL